MENKIVITVELERSLKNMNDDDLVRINQFFSLLSSSDGIKKLKNKRSVIFNGLNYFSVKVSQYRLIYKYSKTNELIFFKILTMKDDITKLEVKWYDLYTFIAGLLVEFYFNNTEKASLRLLHLCSEHHEFYELNDWARKRNDLDPIDIFSSFNSININNIKRVKRLNVIYETLCDYFNLNFSPLINVDFIGCPSIYGGLGATVGRSPWAQEDVWKVFHNAVLKDDISNFDLEQIKDWYGIGISSFTIFLFWINYKNFIPLDKKTISFLISNNTMEKVPSTTEEYLELITEKNTNKYLELSIYSYNNVRSDKYSELIKNSENLASSSKLGESIESKLEAPSFENIQNGESKITSFGIVAIRPLDGCRDSYLKTLKLNEYYILNDAYVFEENNIIYNQNEDFNLHSIEGLNINICAVVGKNGTGKSTLTELIYVAINNISHRISKGVLDVSYADDVYVELYVKLDKFYCIRIEGKNVSAIAYDFNNDVYIPNKITEIDNLDLSNLFYTISINYSQHAMNCSESNNNWLDKLFHKNDGYQTPIVIEPFREKGNIDVNRQEILVKQRLLVNLLEPGIDDSEINSHRRLSEYNYATGIKLSLNYDKFQYVYKEINGAEVSFDDFSDVMIKSTYLIRDFFDISSSRKPKFKHELCETIEDYIELYLFKKLINISLKYKYYNDFFDRDILDFSNLKAFLTKLSENESHITYKLNQAINFLKDRFSGYNYFNLEGGVQLSLDEYTDYISKKKKLNPKIKTVNLVPPSCFNIDIILNDSISFQSLSSGEKQKIYTLNSIYYHLNNIASVHNNLINYRYVNLILDEVELYFHPELQRNYINDLIEGISKIDIGGVLALNIIFVTHSPFIISDIIESRVMFLTKNSSIEKSFPVIKNKKIKTFGANIHELLMSGFFMENSIGQFSLSCIEMIVDFHNKVLSSNKDELTSLRNEFDDNKAMFEYITSNVGETYVQGVLRNHLDNIYNKLNDNSDYKKRRITELQEELKLLQGEL